MVVGYTAICVRLAAGLWFPLGTPVPSTNKTGCHDITEILLKMREKWHNRLMTFNSHRPAASLTQIAVYPTTI
jgi:hypothetical protein